MKTDNRFLYKKIPSLQLSINLRDYGYPQKGAGYYWFQPKFKNKYHLSYTHMCPVTNPIKTTFKVYTGRNTIISYGKIMWGDFIKAPTIQEILEYINKKLESIHDIRTYLVIDLFNTKTTTAIVKQTANSKIIFQTTHTIETEAAAKLLLYLIQNKYIIP